jgi:hypothetical protein
LAPEPVLREVVLHHVGLARERDVRRRHVWRHHRIHVVGPDDLVEQVDEDALHAVRAALFRVIGVEEDHEQTAGGGLGDGARLARVVRFDARLLRTWPAHVDVLEGLDLLHDAVLEDLEVVRGQIANRHALEGRIRVHANEVRAHTESRLIGGGRRRGLRFALWRRRVSPARLRRWRLRAPTGRRGGKRNDEENVNSGAASADEREERTHGPALREAAPWHGTGESRPRETGWQASRDDSKP